MTNQTGSPLLLRWPGRIAVLAGATLVFPLSAAPVAHADDGGLLGGVTQVVGGATQPVVPPAVQSAVPQPVQEAVEPVVEAVVEPAESQAEQAAPPVTEVVEPAVRRAENQGEQPVEDPAAQDVDPAVGSAQAPVTPQAPVPGGPTSSHAVDGPGHGGSEPSAAATNGPRDEQRPSGVGGCTGVSDLPPRAMAVSALLQHPGRIAGESEQALWDLTNALMHLWVEGDAPRSVDVGSPDGGVNDLRAFGLPDGGTTDLPALDTSSADRMLRVLGLFGLLGLLGLLAAGLTVILAPRLE